MADLPSTPMLKLPNELLDHIFSYLDWDRSKDLYPTKPDIINGSLTCRKLREALKPLVFRDVTLRLRWVRGQLIEPCLYRLRCEHPELARHIRCVFIRTEYEQCQHCVQKGDPKPFVVPEDVKDWLNPSGDPHVPVGEGEFRERATVLAHRTVWPDTEQTRHPDHVQNIVMQGKRESSLAPDLDALSIVMLCIPSCTSTVVFKSLPQSPRMASRNRFALRLLSTALQLLGDRLEDLTLASTNGTSHPGLSRAQHANLGQTTEELDGITTEVIQDLELKRICFALGETLGNRKASERFEINGFERWHRASSTVRELDICNAHGDSRHFVEFIKGFTCLRKLNIRQCELHVPYTGGGQAGQHQKEEAQKKIWLIFAIELRQALQHVEIGFDNVFTASVVADNFSMSRSAVQWILTQAVPPGVLIDADRQERLMEDYVSFLPLWKAEDSERGILALDDWVKKRGPLSDAAMSRRWR